MQGLEVGAGYEVVLVAFRGFSFEAEKPALEDWLDIDWYVLFHTIIPIYLISCLLEKLLDT